MAATVLLFYKKNDQIVQVVGLKNKKTGAYLNAATVAVSMKDKDGATVLNSATLDYEAASNGVYSAIVQETFDAPAGKGYTLYVDAAQSGANLHIEAFVEVKIRRS